MKTGLKVHFYLRKTGEKKNGECPVIGKITIGKDVAQFSAKVTAKASLWDIVSGRVTGKSKHASEVNATLDKISVAINTSYRKLQEEKNTITANEVKNAFQGIASQQETLIRYFARHNEEFKKRVGVNRELSTQVQYENSLNHLKRFMSLKCKLSDIPFTQLDFSFIGKYDFYLRVELKLKPNTILGIMRHLRKMIKLAIGEGIITRDPFEGYSPERPKPEQKYLTRDELNKIMVTPLDHPCRYLTRDMFLFSVFTGLAYRDICNLTAKNIVRASDGVLWIETTRQKTGTPCEIPLMEIPLQILDKYKGLAPDDKLLPMLSCGKLNKNLKVIAKLCNINKRLIFHMGRHTYASEICLSQGVPIETVSRMLGHRDLRSTQIYAKISNDKISEDTDKLEERIKNKFRLVGIEQ
ncbi:site-specific integrase [uncultured Bacteroides sp.]|mgnify:FL=1|uniref:site-specific integrase n=1 Tax=uncultured Bacteroides sp. TaxID=162156 RepID=UPI00280A61E0|nr:site-specific integrase [uncultured Bacteroides sp.]